MRMKPDTAVAVYELHAQAQGAVKALQRVGFDMMKISIIGRDYALAGALMGIGIPKDAVPRYETALKAYKFMLVVHGDAEEIKRADVLLKTSGLTSFDHHRGQRKAVSKVHA